MSLKALPDGLKKVSLILMRSDGTEIKVQHLFDWCQEQLLCVWEGVPVLAVNDGGRWTCCGCGAHVDW